MSEEDKMLPGPDISISKDKILELEKSLHGLEFDESKDSKFKRDFSKYETLEYEKEVEKKLEEPGNSEIYEERLKAHSDALFLEFMDKYEDREYMRMQKFRKSLPAYHKRQEILEMIDKNQVVLIKGETGCGKTTQVPQYILDDFLLKQNGAKCRIICSQPRRIASISVSERVAAERAEPLGVSTGYHIRLEKRLPRTNGSILFCTTQVIQKFMESDPALIQFNFVIVDECHERQVHIDLLLGLLKKLIKYRKDIKIILMSATLQADTISRYFGNCPTLHIEGKMYPVQELFLEDVIDDIGCFDFPEIEKNAGRRRNFSDRGSQDKIHQKIENFKGIVEPYVRTLQNQVSRRAFEILESPFHEAVSETFILELIFYIAEKKPSGAILVFLPGLSVITKLFNSITKSRNFSPNRFVVYPLHSTLTGADQRAIFQKPPPHVRKIILATQIAECSITVDDVVYIVNPGFHKKTYFDGERSCNVLEQQMITKANEIQRKGRAGRTQEGVCYHLYTRLVVYSLVLLFHSLFSLSLSFSNSHSLFCSFLAIFLIFFSLFPTFQFQISFSCLRSF